MAKNIKHISTIGGGLSILISLITVIGVRNGRIGKESVSAYRVEVLENQAQWNGEDIKVIRQDLSAMKATTVVIADDVKIIKQILMNK